MSPSAEIADLTYTASGTLDVRRCVTTYAPLVKRIANYILAKLPASVQLDDLVQAGMIGLMEACDRFEEMRGIQFEAYASQRIRGAMLDELRDADWLPRSARKAARNIEAAIHKVQQARQRSASEAEIAAEMKISLSEYQSMLQEAKGMHLFHYDGLSGDDEESFLDRNLADETENPLEKLSDKRLAASLIEAIKALPEREQLLMSLYYEREMNFREIAEVIGVTESRVCQLHSQSVARIRAHMKNW